MWSRAELKDRAKVNLRKFYWQLFAVSLVMIIAGGIYISGPFAPSGSNGGGNHQSNSNFSFPLNENITVSPPNFGFFKFDGQIFHSSVKADFSSPELFMNSLALLMASGILLFAVATIVWRIFLGYPLEVGCRRFFVSATEERHAYSDINSCFNNENYWNVVKTMFMRALFTFLWFLALIVPGIIKSFAYSMVPYILTDNPNMPYNEAIALSQDMTRGHKFDIFVLNLSFIGWYLLGMLLCGLGGVLVNPYYLMTTAELYKVLRTNAIEKGFCSAADLNLPEVF